MSKPNIYNVIATDTTEPRDIRDRFSDIINVKDFGAKGDGIHDDTEVLKKAFNYGITSGKTVYIPSGTYLFSRINIIGAGKTLNILCEGELFSIATSPINNTSYGVDYSIRFSGNKIFTSDFSFKVLAESNQFNKNTDWDIQIGDLIIWRTNRSVSCGYRGNWCDGIVSLVSDIKDNTVYLEEPISIYIPGNSSSEELIAQSGTTTSIIFSSDITNSDMLYDLECVSGANKGEIRKINSFDFSTKTAKFNVSLIGQTAWPNAIAAGDKFILHKKTTISCYRPIKVNSKGLKVSRNLQTDSESGRYGFFGPRVDYGVYCSFEDTLSKNFSETAFGLFYCYKPFIHNIKLYNANMEYTSSNNPTDGTGYGLLEVGVYGGTYNNIFVSGCRAAVNCGGMDVLNIFNTHSNITVYNGNIPRYDGSGIVKTASAIGGHGNFHSGCFSNISTYNVEAAITASGYNWIIDNINIFGNTKNAVVIGYVQGIIVNNIKFNSTCSTNRSFCIIRSLQYKRDKPIIFKNVDSYNEIRSLFSFYDSTNVDDFVIENIHLHNINAYYIDNPITVNCFGSNTPNIRFNNVTITGTNVLHYIGDKTNYGFINTNILKVMDNGYVQAGNNIYLVKPSIQGLSKIPLYLTSSSTQFRVSIFNGNSNTVSCDNVNLWWITGGSGDLNIQHTSNKSSTIHVRTSAEDAYAENAYSIWIDSTGYLNIYNNTDSAYHLYVILEYPH